MFVFPIIGVGLSQPAAARSFPAPGGLVLEKGGIEAGVSLDFFSGANFFDEEGTGREASNGISFTQGRATFGVGYGLTSGLTVRAFLPVTRREYTYIEAGYHSEDCYCLGQTTQVDFIFPAPAALESTGMGDVTLEASYQVFSLAENRPEFAVRAGTKLAVGSDEVNYHRHEANLGDGQHDLILGLDGKGDMEWLVYDVSLEYRVRFEGSYRISDLVSGIEQSFYPRYDPGDEFSANGGCALTYRQLTLGVSAHYIYTGQSKTWLEDIFETEMEGGYYFGVTPGIGVLPSEDSLVSLSIEVPLWGKNYPRDVPYFHYRFQMSFLYRL